MAAAAAIRSSNRRRQARQDEQDNEEFYEEVDDAILYPDSNRTDSTIQQFLWNRLTSDDTIGTEELLNLLLIIERKSTATSNKLNKKNYPKLVQEIFILFGTTCFGEVPVNLNYNEFYSMISKLTVVSPQKQWPDESNHEFNLFRNAVKSLNKKIFCDAGVCSDLLTTICSASSSTEGATRIEDSNEVCSICRSTLSDVELSIHETVRRIPCGHLFHEKCIYKWFERSQDCPLCRKNILIEQGKKAKEIESIGIFTLRTTRVSTTCAMM